MAIITGDTVNNRYKLLEKLGDGGMGEVFLADDLQLSRQVAVKTIRHELKENPEVRQRIDRECNLHAKLGVHPNIVALHDRIDDDANIFLVMEYVPGETMSALMAESKEKGTLLQLHDAISIVRQTLEALSYIHEHDIIHRDIKPSNIILKESQGRYIAKLMDFGIAYLENNDEALTKLTTMVTGGPGTPAYMAPERIDAETFGQQGPATDLYSVGIILYELLGGIPPFHGSMTEVFTGHLAKAPDYVSISQSVPGPLLGILEKSLKKKQEERYQDARDFLDDLKAGTQDRSETVLSTGIPTFDKTVLATGREREALVEAVSSARSATDKHKKKSMTPYVIAVALVLLISVVGTFLFLRNNPSGKKQEQLAEGKKILDKQIDMVISPADDEISLNPGIKGASPIKATPIKATPITTTPTKIDGLVKELNLDPVESLPVPPTTPVLLDPPSFSQQDQGTNGGSESAEDTFRKWRDKKRQTAQVIPAPKPKPKSQGQRSNTNQARSKNKSEWKIIDSGTRKISN